MGRAYAAPMADRPEVPSVAVVGAGGLGREVLDVIEAANRVSPVLRFVGFVDDAPTHPERLAARGATLLSGLDDPALEGAGFLVGIGDPDARRRVDERARACGLWAAGVRHPSATFGAVNVIGEGFVACAHASVTTTVSIGRHVFLNLHVTVGHDATLGDFVTVNPGANVSGNVHLGDGVTLGTGAAVIQGVTVGAGTIVGAGAVVTRDLPEGVVAVGAPARPVRSVG
jgi:sugar O-acyltransferase (sialic acid O-acetyltransferase NeuD family)